MCWAQSADALMQFSMKSRVFFPILYACSLSRDTVPFDFNVKFGSSGSFGKDRNRYSNDLGIIPGSSAVPTIV